MNSMASGRSAGLFIFGWFGARLGQTLRFLERQSLLLAGVGLLLLLAVNVPLFLRMPLWPDAALYDICARGVLRGAVFYRDYFDGDLPGFLWLHMLIRSLAGWSPEVLRLADLQAVGTSIAILVGGCQEAATSWSRRAWLTVGLVAFYFSTSEYCHCQRDVWMLAPALLALVLRHRQLVRVVDHSPRTATVVVAGLVEGLLWGSAIWIKPHGIVLALVAWIFSLRVLLPAGAEQRRLAACDLGGLLTGGLLAGGLGIAWIVQTGAWPAFVDTFFGWNLDYIPREALKERLRYLGGTFFPWSLVHLAAVPLALWSLVRWLYSREHTWQPLLSLLYLGWLVQAVFGQHPFAYHLVPPLFLAMTVVVSSAITSVPALRWGMAVFLLSMVALHPMWYPERLAAWARCWREDSQPDLWDHLRLVADRDVHLSFHYADMERVALYLREQNVSSGDVTCYDWRTTNLYTRLDIGPSTRFIQWSTVWLFYPSHRGTVMAEVANCRAKFVVSDLTGAGLNGTEAAEIGPDGAFGLPPRFPPSRRGDFPWKEPIVFRAGRYTVHRVTR